MRTLAYFVGSTIAGFIAGPERRLDSFFPVEDDVTAAILAEFPGTAPTRFRGPAGLADTPNEAPHSGRRQQGRSSRE
ncbi:hypothetical protein ACQPYK_04670 [Streptosporangium sp. CA-135522]|uniref:hypothetical protein n=1 Tax=Streptosporangium sp. CA-135522 TaxID=3240072 RepID=UPI003D8B6004